MSCTNCHDPACTVEAAESTERITYAWLQAKGSKEAGERWKAASEALEAAQSDCVHRAAYRHNADTLARLAAIEARQNRIEAMLVAKGYTP